MIDRFGRTIDYLRIAVTDRCNLRCVYCMPSEGINLMRHDDVLRFEEIVDVARAAVNIGVRKIRLTGGEPLVRLGVESLVAQLAAIDSVADLAMTTNGVLLPKYAPLLAEAGLHRVNVSLDAIDAERYAALTRGGDVREVLAGIEAARKAGLEPVKLNCVLSPKNRDAEGITPDAHDVEAFAKREGLEVRFIEQMDLAGGHFSVVHGGSGGDCRRCNRLRLTSDGQIRPCLFSDLSFSVRKLGAAEAIAQAIAQKPSSGSTCSDRTISMIGG
ncbi:MAG: radical SAM protein [Planctomycetota bacterium]|nr:radical SAM protein [Planctomycetota bacterium]